MLMSVWWIGVSYNRGVLRRKESITSVLQELTDDPAWFSMADLLTQ